MKKLILLLLFIPLVSFGQDQFIIQGSEESKKFEITKNNRYLGVIERFNKIEFAQELFKKINGNYSNSLDELIDFIGNGKIPLIIKKDSTYMEYDERYGIDMIKEVVVTETVGYDYVKDILFPSKSYDRYFRDYSYKKIGASPVTNKKFNLKSYVINEGGYDIPIFELRVTKELILSDQIPYLIKNEIEKNRNFDGIDYSQFYLRSTSGIVRKNWDEWKADDGSSFISSLKLK